MDSAWHRANVNLLIESILYHFHSRTDFYVGGNMFIYFSHQQAMSRDFRGPDFFFVDGINLRPERRYWVTWFENGRLPDVVIELVSPTTEREDRTTKFRIYEQVFRTPNYFLYDPDTRILEGWQPDASGHYQAMTPNARSWIWSSQLGLLVGTWEGEYQRNQTTWLRFYDEKEQLVLLPEEQAEQPAESVRLRTDGHRRRAEAAEVEIARLRALLSQPTELNVPTPPPA